MLTHCIRACAVRLDGGLELLLTRAAFVQRRSVHEQARVQQRIGMTECSRGYGTPSRPPTAGLPANANAVHLSQTSGADLLSASPVNVPVPVRQMPVRRRVAYGHGHGHVYGIEHALDLSERHWR